LEALAELGVDPEAATLSLLPAPSSDSEESSDSDAESSQDSPALQEEFEPVGRAPYFDPQLDRAVDYLLGTLDVAEPEAPEAEPAAE
jgi:hypothetical protein